MGGRLDRTGQVRLQRQVEKADWTGRGKAGEKADRTGQVKINEKAGEQAGEKAGPDWTGRGTGRWRRQSRHACVIREDSAAEQHRHMEHRQSRQCWRRQCS